MELPRRLRLSSFTMLILGALLSSCISYQPRQLVPSISLSAEDLQLQSSQSGNLGVDFGLETALNESDSLLNIEILPGVRVRTVNPGSPASLAGLQPGDVILKVDGMEINHPDALDALAQQTVEETEFELQLRRNTAVLQANLVARPVSAGNTALRELYRVDPIASRAGYRTELLSVRGQADIAAARVVEILPESPLPAADLNVDDIIIAVDGRAVGSAQGLVSLLNTDYLPGDTVMITVFRDGDLRDQRLTLWDPGRRLSKISLLPLLQYESTLSPQHTSFSLLDLWLFAIYRYDRTEGERQHRLLEIFSISSDYGELLEETR